MCRCWCTRLLDAGSCDKASTESTYGLYRYVVHLYSNRGTVQYVVHLYKLYSAGLRIRIHYVSTDPDPALPKAVDPDQTPDPEAIPGHFRSSLIFVLFLIILNF